VVPLDLDRLPALVNHLAGVWSNTQSHSAKRQNALIVAALLYGLGSQEACNLRPTNVAVSLQQLRFRSVKDGPTRTVSTNETWCRAAIEVWHDMPLRRRHTKFLFSTIRGRQLKWPNVRKACATHTQRIFGVAFSPHCCRHTAALVCWLQTKDMRAVQLLLGHANLRSTEAYLRTITGTTSVNTIDWSLSKRPLTIFIPTEETA
jgi:site-specific recombinase XerD